MARLVVADEARRDIAEILIYLRREAGDRVARDYPTISNGQSIS
jgi:hypothetical protein